MYSLFADEQGNSGCDKPEQNGGADVKNKVDL